jgi:superfamily II DNA or RNA helicase
MSIRIGGVNARRRITPEYGLRFSLNPDRALSLFPTEPGSMGRRVLQGKASRIGDFDLEKINVPRSTTLGGGLNPYAPGRSSLLKHIFISRSLWWDSTSKRFTDLGDDRDLLISWVAQGKGWVPQLGVADHPAAYVLGEFAEFYVDPEAMVGGALRTALPTEFVQRILKQKIFSDAEALAFCEEMRRGFPNDKMPLPEHRAVELSRLEYAHAQLTQQDGSLVIEVGFCYGEGVIWGFDDIHHVHDGKMEGKLYRVTREIGRERDRWVELGQAVRGQNTSPKLFYPEDQSPENVWRAMDKLADLGWEIETSSALNLLPIRTLNSALSPSGKGYAMVCETEIFGKKSNLLPLVVRYLKSSMTSLEEIAAGRGYTDDTDIFLYSEKQSFRVPIPLIRHVLQHMAEVLLHNGQTEGMRLSHFQAAELLRRHPAQWKAPEGLRRRADDFDAPPIHGLPAGLKAHLRAYQKDGVDWLRLWQHYGLNGILADEMGLGKTVQVIALLLSLRGKEQSLIIAPTSVIPNWQSELAKFAPSLKVAVWHGADRKTEAKLDGADIILTNYSLMGSAPDELMDREYTYVIADESQAIKNSRTMARAAMSDLNARHRLCMTGTPIENHLGELWSMLDYLNPGVLGAEADFRLFYQRPIEAGDKRRKEMLLRKIKPLILRRTKKDVALPVPPKSGKVVEVPMEQAQRGLYDGIRVAVAAEVQKAIAEKGVRRSQIEIFAALLKLRQACCDSRLLKHKVAQHPESAKLVRLRADVHRKLKAGHSLLIFSQFAEMLDLIQAELAGVPMVRLDGSTIDRATPVKRFQAGEVKVFLISLKAGGSGLNLTAADTVILYDPWWNPAVEAQAIDRAHRLGQSREVTFYRYVCVNTIEERILTLQDQKRAMAASILDDAGGERGAHITEDDLRFLLGV